MDADEHNARALKQTRDVHTAQLTTLYKELEDKMLLRENVNIVKQLFVKLRDTFELLKESHSQCLSAITQSEVKKSLEDNFLSHRENFIEFQQYYCQWVADNDAMLEVIPQIEAERASSIASSRTSLSSRSKLASVKAKRLLAENRLKNLKARLELEAKQKLLAQEEEIEEALIEETVWQQVVNEEENVNQECEVQSKTQNHVETTDRSCRRDSIVKLPDITSNNSADENGRAITDSVACRRESSMGTAIQSLATALHEGFNLPKPEILTFAGNPVDYSKFVRSFETNIEGKVSDDNSKLSYLIQYCIGEPRRCIEDCVMLSATEGYKKARAILHARYGRPHVISRSYMESLLYGPTIKPSDSDSLSKLSLDMQKCEMALSQLGFPADINNTENLRRIVKRLPLHLGSRWADVADSINESGREAHFNDLSRFIEERARIACSMFGTDLNAESNIGQKSDKKIPSNCHSNGKVATFSTQTESRVHVVKNINNSNKCKCCSGICTDLALCNVFKSYNLDQKYEFLRKHRRCFNCLKSKHYAYKCTSKRCAVSNCNKRHHMLLHKLVDSERDHTAVKSLVHCSAVRSSVLKNCLGIIPVSVTGGNGNSFRTYALLDNGADKTLCNERLLVMLDEPGRPVTYQMATVSDSAEVVHGKEIDLNVKTDTSDADEIAVRNVWSVKKLPISTRSTATTSTLHELPYLAGIDIPKVDNKDVMLLIGTDTPAAHIPLEVRSGDVDQPYAIRSRLGWAIRGPVHDERHPHHCSINMDFEDSGDEIQHRGGVRQGDVLMAQGTVSGGQQPLGRVYNTNSNVYWDGLTRCSVINF